MQEGCQRTPLDNMAGYLTARELNECGGEINRLDQLVADRPARCIGFG